MAVIGTKVVAPLCLFAVVYYGFLYFDAPWLAARRFAKSTRR
jgi:hypothetical protein